MSVRGVEAPLFAHDDDQFDDVQDQDFPSTDAPDENDWQPAEPSWRSRIAADSSGERGTMDRPDDGRRRGTSIISLGTAINGTLRSEDPIYIEGSFEGEIIASSDVTVARGATVNARIQAIRLTVAGQVTGAVACTDRFEALDTGEVKAEVLSPVFVVHEGATINGSLKMRFDDDDDLEDLSQDTANDA